LAGLAGLSAWILISGLDDLFIAAVRLFGHGRPFPWPSEADLEALPERPIAILVPLWQEHRVIGRMLQLNLATIRYHNYRIFVGIYPNDGGTASAVAEIAARDNRIVSTQVPHSGPTSKGDCLNWTFSAMRAWETSHGVRFEVVVTHDAEDLIHADSLTLINWFSREYQMVQIPVLALPTPALELTHGIYCDEFAEFQSKDIPVRQRLGGFLPSNGVGTGFERGALERLAATRRGVVFDPVCLTEDYENGFALHALGCRQIFVPLRHGGGATSRSAATREYFPRTLRQAVRQRSRWVAGIALQGWQRHGWRVPWPQVYWFWRDRKGLAGNLLAPAANVAFIAGLVGWRHGARFPAWLLSISAATCCLSLAQIGLRSWYSARIYGWRFASAVPLRMIWANVVNFLATVSALGQFASALLQRQTLDWKKTDHLYPAHHTGGRGRLGEVLARVRCVPRGEIEDAVQKLPKGVRLGEYLVQLQKLSTGDLYWALSLHAGMELGMPEPQEFNRRVVRSLPAETIRRWKVLPYRVSLGQLHMVTTEVPSEPMMQALSRCSGLEPRFRLVRPDEFDRLVEEFLSEPMASPIPD
jgi:adsorption protein B